MSNNTKQTAAKQNKKIVAILEISGNPNGEMNEDNHPRILPSGFGFMTGASISRKIRTYFESVSPDQVFLKSNCVVTTEASNEFKKGTKTQEELFNKYKDVRIFGLMRGKDATYLDAKGVPFKDTKQYKWNSRAAATITCESALPLNVCEHSLSTSFIQKEKENNEKNSTLGTFYKTDNFYILEIDIHHKQEESGRIRTEDINYLIEGIKNLHFTNTNYRKIVTQEIGVLEGEYTQNNLRRSVRWSVKADCLSFEEKTKKAIFQNASYTPIMDGDGILSSLFNKYSDNDSANHKLS